MGGKLKEIIMPAFVIGIQECKNCTRMVRGRGVVGMHLIKLFS